MLLLLMLLLVRCLNVFFHMTIEKQGEFVVSTAGSNRAKAQAQRGPGKPLTMVPINIFESQTDAETGEKKKPPVAGEPFHCHLIDSSAFD